MMPELTGNYTSFAFLSSLYQEMSLFLVFNVASRRQPFWAAILNLKVKTDPKYNEYQFIRSAKPELEENDALQVLKIHLAEEKSLLLFLNMVSETITG